jgi:ketosteroid isomerase-like protein
MKHIWSLGFALLAAAFSAAPALADEATDSVRAAMHAFDSAYSAKDEQALRKMTAANAILVSNGKKQSVEEGLKEIASEKVASELSSTIETIEVIDSVAIVSGTLTWKEDGDSGHERFTTVFKRVDGAWVVILDHVSEIPKAKK